MNLNKLCEIDYVKENIRKYNEDKENLYVGLRYNREMLALKEALAERKLITLGEKKLAEFFGPLYEEGKTYHPDYGMELVNSKSGVLEWMNMKLFSEISYTPEELITNPFDQLFSWGNDFTRITENVLGARARLESTWYGVKHATIHETQNPDLWWRISHVVTTPLLSLETNELSEYSLNVIEFNKQGLKIV